MKTLLVLAFSLPLLALVACNDPQTTGSGEHNATPLRATGTVAADATSQAVREGGGGGLRVEVKLNEWSVQSDAETVAPGTVEFEVTNLGDVLHEFVVVKSDRPVEDLPVTGGYVQLDGLDVLAREGPFEGGEGREVSTTLSLGNYVLFCNQPGHYQGGMRTRLAVR